MVCIIPFSPYNHIVEKFLSSFHGTEDKDVEGTKSLVFENRLSVEIRRTAGCLTACPTGSVTAQPRVTTWNTERPCQAVVGAWASLRGGVKVGS